MARSPEHWRCPKGSGGKDFQGRLKGRTAPAYVRESYVETSNMGSWERQVGKRRWVRAGTVCLDCGQFALGSNLIPIPPDTVREMYEQERYSETPAAIGIPTGSG